MEAKAADESSSGDASDKEREISAMSKVDIPRAPSLEFEWLPETLRQVVADYLSNDERDPTKCTLLGKQRITLCLSQDSHLDFDVGWYFSFTSFEEKRKFSMEDNVKVKFSIKNYECCFDFLSYENPVYCPIIVEVLVFQLVVSSNDFLGALDDLQETLEKLQKHLNCVHTVVFVIEKFTYFYFSLKDVVDNATGLTQTVRRLDALKRILGDLRDRWQINHTLSTKLLLDHYIRRDVKPESDIYLSKFVILFNYCRNRDLFDAVAPTLKSSKLMWIYYFECPSDVKNINLTTTSHCHAFHLDVSRYHSFPRLLEGFEHAFSFQDNPFIKQIIVDADVYGHAMLLPRPKAPLTDTTPLSALVQLTLKGFRNTLHLTDLNNGYFPNLTSLCVIDGEITGHLDSRLVPHLITLILEPETRDSRYFSRVRPCLRSRVQSLLCSGLPWQLVASQKRGGWSLASYDDPTANPHDDGKERSALSLPVIRELMLVMQTQKHANEFQSRLNGDFYLEAAADNQNDGLLVWAPERVQRITAFCISMKNPQLQFKEIPGRILILDTLRCHNIEIELNGAVLPKLKSLELNGGLMKPLGSFRQLQTLSLQGTTMGSSWCLVAPMLQTLSCHNLANSSSFLLRPEFLSHLSFLQLTLWKDDVRFCPDILVQEDSMGLSRISHVVLGKNMTLVPFFEQYQVYRVLHLELNVNALTLPICWYYKVWQCETLTVNAYVLKPDDMDLPDAPVIVVLPGLPRVRKLTVTEENCRILLDREMPELTECTVPSPKSLGPNLKCAKLRCIYFTKKLSESDKEKCLDRATYEAIGAQPRLVYLDYDGKVRVMSWNAAPNAVNISDFAGSLEDGGSSSVSHE